MLFEIATREPVTATVLQDALDMDAGYLSRLVARFEKRGWMARVRRDDDARARAADAMSAAIEAEATSAPRAVLRLMHSAEPA